MCLLGEKSSHLNKLIPFNLMEIQLKKEMTFTIVAVNLYIKM